ncbi:type II secretion system F family protein [Geminicoccaceae bacterium 1502E]|nr:type II secretion system F family protein [Geminicoccaceae bacterium 1502E]
MLVHQGWSWPTWRAAALGILIATAGPTLLIRRRIARRERRFLQQLPDALDLVVRAVRSGLPVTEALQSIAGEMRDPARTVFRDLCANVRIGMSLGDALALAAERIHLPEFRFFAISLIVQQETGGNLAEILQNLSTMLRRRYQVRLKIKAMSSEARASAMIIGALPFLTGTAIYWINPDYMAKLFIDPRGWMLLLAGSASLLMGLFVMGKMTRFEV